MNNSFDLYLGSTEPIDLDYQGLRVLVVNDELAQQMVLKLIMAKLPEVDKARIQIATNGFQALSKLEASYFDIVLMDINMPEMGGVEATCRIRENFLQNSGILEQAMMSGLRNNKLEQYIRNAIMKELQGPLIVGVTSETITLDLHLECSNAGMNKIYCSPVNVKTLR
jgi:CheY-like chemotaxis protein